MDTQTPIKGAGVKLTALIRKVGPQMLKEFSKSPHLSTQQRTALSFAGPLLQRVEFDDATATNLLEMLDWLNHTAWDAVESQDDQAGLLEA